MRRRRLWAVLYGIAIVAALVLLRALDPFPVRVARETAFDTFQQLLPRAAPADLPLRIIDIDEPALAALGQWPWPRQTMAELTERLSELGAVVIAYDVLFSEPDRASAQAGAGAADGDAAFAEALAETPSVLVLSRATSGNPAPPPRTGFAMTGNNLLASLPLLDGVAVPLPGLAAAAAGLGVASLDQGGAGIARRLPLLWSNGSAPLPALSVEALRLALGVSTLVLLGDTAGAGTPEGLRIGDLAVPTGPQGDMWLYYRHMEPAAYVSAGAVLADDYRTIAPLVAGHIVLIGTSAAGLMDIRETPLGMAMPGVAIHFQAIEQMLTGTFLQRSDWVGGVELLVIVVSTLAVVLALLLTGPLRGLLISGLIAMLATAGSWLAFARFGLLVDPSFPLLAILLSYAAMAFFQFAVTDADKRRIRSAFAHYVEPALLDRLEADGRLLKLGGDLRDITVMFSDVRNFTALGERSTPAELVTILNRLFAALGTAIIAHHGTIDKFMGDAVMAFWNAPADVPDHPRHACAAALDMRAALRQLNRQQADAQPIAVGIGLSSGPALVGNMGFAARFDYSCVGETVNVASRLESACKVVGYDILVTDATRFAASEFAWLSGGALALKGMSEPEPIHLLVGSAAVARSADFAALQAAHESLAALWAAGKTDDALLAACRERAATIDPGLIGFYAACEGRLGDFRQSDDIAGRFTDTAPVAPP